MQSPWVTCLGKSRAGTCSPALLTPGPRWECEGSWSRDLCVLFIAPPQGLAQCLAHSRCLSKRWWPCHCLTHSRCSGLGTGAPQTPLPVAGGRLCTAGWGLLTTLLPEPQDSQKEQFRGILSLSLCLLFVLLLSIRASWALAALAVK